MEASPRQLPIDDGDSVRVLGDRLVIERLEIDDARAAALVRERAGAGQQPGATVRSAIEIGSRVLESEGTAANVDYVKAELERNLGGVADRLSELLEEGQGGLAEHLAASFDPERSGSVQQQFREILNAAQEHQRAQLAKQFSAQDGSNPLADFREGVIRALKESHSAQQAERHADRKRIEEMTAELAKLRERFGAKVEIEAEQARGTAKGIGFEERVYTAIEKIAAARGDVAQHVGDEAGAAGSKKGDVLVEVGACEGPPLGRIVFEAKDSRLSKPKAWDELNGALTARAASFAVLVVAGENNVPSDRDQLHEYEGNKLIVAVDPEQPDDSGLAVAYRFARLRVLLSREAELSVDGARVRDAAAEARGALDALKAIKSSLTKATNNVDQAKTTVEGMVAIVIDRLERIESLVSVAEDDG